MHVLTAPSSHGFDRTEHPAVQLASVHTVAVTAVRFCEQARRTYPVVLLHPRTADCGRHALAKRTAVVAIRSHAHVVWFAK